MSPGFERFENGQKFFIVSIVVQLHGGETLGKEGDWMDLTIRVGLGEDCRDSVVRRVRLDDYRSVWGPVRQNWGGGERFLEVLECGAALVGEAPDGAFPSKTSERNNDLRVIADESAIEIHEAQEGLYIADFPWFGPILNAIHFGWVHREAIRRQYKS